ncbi:MAG: hypothetical protein Q8R83_03055 [Legionellaceae bacterium]|nr:hypothetical protein [Legionellaceae bacterium]
MFYKQSSVNDHKVFFKSYYSDIKDFAVLARKKLDDQFKNQPMNDQIARIRDSIVKELQNAINASMPVFKITTHPLEMSTIRNTYALKSLLENKRKKIVEGFIILLLVLMFLGILSGLAMLTNLTMIGGVVAIVAFIGFGLFLEFDRLEKLPDAADFIGQRPYNSIISSTTQFWVKNELCLFAYMTKDEELKGLRKEAEQEIDKLNSWNVADNNSMVAEICSPI